MTPGHRGTGWLATLATAAALGASPASAHFPHDVIAELAVSGDGADAWQKATQNSDGAHHIFEDQLRLKTGTLMPVEWTTASFAVGSETYYIGVARDLTDRKAADGKRIEAERLQTLLEISGGRGPRDQPAAHGDPGLRRNGPGCAGSRSPGSRLPETHC